MLELYADIIELRKLGLTEEEIEGYLEFFGESLDILLSEVV
jgi:hypothetical protein